MNYSALWLDHKHARLFTFKKTNGVLFKEPLGEEEFSFDEPVDHHSRHPNDVNHDVKDQNLDKFFHKITDKLENEDFDQLILLGPGTTKSQFKHHCEEHDHKKIYKALVGIETMGSHPTKHEIVETAKVFFDSQISHLV
jgi:stalled ribosome rescue protein Dom34